MAATTTVERFDTIVIGGGQAGLSVGYHLAKQHIPFVILDASPRIGQVWRERWDSLRLFTPARFSSLDGLPFPSEPFSFPTKDEMADYLELYARTFNLPVRSGVRVDRLSRQGRGFVITAGAQRFEADRVIVAMGTYQRPRVPAYASELDPGIVQLHSLDYKSPAQLATGDVLLVGAGNSGAEIAMDVAGHHRTWVAGRSTGEVPFNSQGFAARTFLLWFLFRVVFHRVLTIATPIGRRVLPKMHGGAPLIRTKARNLAGAGVVRVPRVTGVHDGQPVLEDGRTLNVQNIIWCTGFHPGFSWIDIPIFGADGELKHTGGLVPEVPGLYFVGLHLLYAFSSEMIQGVGRDAARIATHAAQAMRRSKVEGQRAEVKGKRLRPGERAKRDEPRERGWGPASTEKGEREGEREKAAAVR